jgi:alpha-tubulin suppressor-like RCC1 family protein
LKFLSTVNKGLSMSTSKFLFLVFISVLPGCGGGGTSSSTTTENSQNTYLDASSSNIHITSSNLDGSLGLAINSDRYSTVVTIGSALTYLNGEISNGDVYSLEVTESPKNQICDITSEKQVTVSDEVLKVNIVCNPAERLTIATFDIPETVTVMLDNGEVAEISSGIDEFTFNSKFHYLESDDEELFIINSPEGYGCAINQLTTQAYLKDIERLKKELYCFPLNQKVIQVSANLEAFSVLREDGRVFVWGRYGSGGDATFHLRDLKNVRSLSETPYRNGLVFTVIYEDGSVLSYGASDVLGANSSSVENLLTNTDRVFHNGYSNIGLTTDNRLVGWGSELYGGNTRLNLTSNVKSMHQNLGAYAALLENGTVVPFGFASFGGEISPSTQLKLINVMDIASSLSGFAALKQDGSVVTWPDSISTTPDQEDLSRLFNVEKVVAANEFVAVTKEGGVVAWGGILGDSQIIDGELVFMEQWLEMQENVEDVVANGSAYAVIYQDRSVKTFGYNDYGADDDAVSSELVNVKSVVALNNTATGAFAALRYDGTVVTWGVGPAADSAQVASELINVKEIFHNNYAFSALREDGSVITWGDDLRGGDSSAVKNELTNVKTIYATTEAFAALKNDGSIVTWGNPEKGGDSSHLAEQLNRF